MRNKLENVHFCRIGPKSARIPPLRGPNCPGGLLFCFIILVMFTNRKWLWLIPLGLALLVGLYFLPPIHERLAWRVDNLRTQINYYFNPPDQAVFQPSQQQVDFDSILATTRAEYSLTLTPPATGTPLPTGLGPTPTPTATSTPLPGSVNLTSFRYEHQHNRWNYCGPANFSMALNFWGWSGDRDVIGQTVMPGNTDGKGQPRNADKNVMPYELQDFISANVPGMTSVLRYGGDIDLVRRLLAAGFPVVAEKGYFEGDALGVVSWMGHYQFITGYDDAKREVTVQDTWNDGPNFRISYDDFMDGWRSFNYVFVVVYPANRDADVMRLLGPLADEDAAARIALQRAEQESRSLTGMDRYFALFNEGTSQVALDNYADAARAYDEAFGVYAQLDNAESQRPFRMMWYQTGPYFAYFYSARYQDVIDLAATTLKPRPKPDLEESLLWRGRAYSLLGQTQLAINDYRAALTIHPNWFPAVQALQELGLKP